MRSQQFHSSVEVSVMEMERRELVVIIYYNNDGTPYTVKVVRTVWSGGKVRDNFKDLPITMKSNDTIRFNIGPLGK